MDQEMLPVLGRNAIRSEQPESEPIVTCDHVAVAVGEPPQSPVVPASVHETEGWTEHDISSMLWIEQEGNEVLARAYTEWEKKEALSTSRIDKMKKRISAIRNEVYMFIISCSVFQMTLLAAVARPSSFHCYNWRYALILSLFASVVTTGGVLQKLFAILKLEKTIHSDADAQQECIKLRNKLRQKRSGFNFDLDAKEGERDKFNLTRHCGFIALWAVILVVFFSFFPISIYRVLCHADAPAPTAAAP